ncbi:putative bifunctional diguanylate cyclase/phosphodiesterase [Krasilnikovia cinnamomea]|uniref:putative bifunctional diguanylate cyclase/phosphodiesterase n=1 Tax=Krasilnikovia cinnamomea TaxID=349313 RepID=UPI001F5FC270|nr:EAL domain-containing protein [Krasilnikovia cinnamomea]
MGVLSIGGYFLLPDHSLPRSIAYNLTGFISSVLILLAVRLHKPQRRNIWIWFAVGQLIWVVGDVVFDYYRLALDEEPYPSLADVFYLFAYPMMIFGLILLVRGGQRLARRDVAGLIDAGIVGTGLGLVFWVFVMEPIAAGTSASLLEQAVSDAYPAMDAVMLALLARLFLGSAKPTMSSRLLGGAALALLAADVAFSVISLHTDYDVGFIDAGWLLSYVLWAAAALHPSMRTTGEAPVTGTIHVGRRRLWLLGACSLIAPAMLLVPDVAANGRDRIAIAFSAGILFLLVVLRMSGFVAEVQRQSGQLQELAMRDDLTGLANRRRFEEALRAEFATGLPQVALFDLNGFKDVNDRFGHAVGDELLTIVASRITSVLRPDAMVARMGGDEFAVLIPNASDRAGDAVVRRLAATFHAPVHAGQQDLLVGASIGIAGAEGADGPMEVLRRADVAMYEAKGTGKPFHRFTTELDQHSTEQARLGAELRAALDADQFQLVYQPIVSLPTGSLASVEALVRWVHPERGWVSPAEFVPVAEQNGLIVELGAWILRTACTQAADWRARLGTRAPARVNVNVSARQLAEPGFADVVSAALADSGLPPSCLVVEVTETAVFEGGRALETLHELHALGVLVALDDFGTGHSSLGLLQTVPVDVLKVDKSFVDNITMAGRHAVIATALINVSTGLGLTAVAEGVETAEQAAELHRLGYRLAQGYHFGKPVAEPDFGTAEVTAVV